MDIQNKIKLLREKIHEDYPLQSLHEHDKELEGEDVKD